MLEWNTDLVLFNIYIRRSQLKSTLIEFLSDIFFLFFFLVFVCIRRTQRKKMYVISTVKRPVPLVHYLYTGTSRQSSDQLYQLVGADHKFLTKG